MRDDLPPIAPSEALQLPLFAESLIRLLEEGGYETWAVGGFVRDGLLGRPGHDVDLATSAPWQEVRRIAQEAGLRVHETGTAHGTVTVAPATPGGSPAVEVTTYRADGSYGDGRHPDEVSFVDTIEEDLARRDFTMNALAFHPERGVIDPFGGQEDLQRGLIRVVGDADARFAEDGLRLLRACRFASQLGFSIEPATRQAMTRSKSRLGWVSAERVTCELDGFVTGAFVHDALMSTWDVLAFAIPEIAAMARCPQDNPYHIYDVLEHTAWTMQLAPPTRLLRWAALCHDMGKPAAAFRGADGVDHFYGHAEVSCRLARGVLGRLLMARTFQDQVIALVRAHDDELAPTPRVVRRALGRLGGDPDLFRALCQLKRADALAHSPLGAARVDAADQLERVLDQVIEEGQAFTVKGLAIDGEDVLALGCAEGPRVGSLLDDALEAVIDGNVANEHEELLGFLAGKLRHEGGLSSP